MRGGGGAWGDGSVDKGLVDIHHPQVPCDGGKELSMLASDLHICAAAGTHPYPPQTQNKENDLIFKK